MTATIDPYAALAQREPAVPGMALLVDPARLARALEDHSGATIESIHPVYLRYKRRTNCLVAYNVSGSMGDTVVHAKALGCDSTDKLEKDSRREAVQTWLGAGPLVLPELAVTVWAHPNDAKLKQLRYLASDEGRTVLMRRAPGQARCDAPYFRPLSYKPQRRFVAALSCADDRVVAAVLKMYTGAGYQQALARSACVSSRDVLSVPARLGRDRRRRLLFFEWLPGRSAAEVVKSEEPLNGRLELVGRALGEMHNQPLAPEMPVSPSYSVAAMRAVISDVQVLFPSLAGRLALLRSRLETDVETLRSSITPIHGDFHLRQVLLSHSSVSLIDFDRSGAGPGVCDLAFCRANLERDVLTGALTRARLEEVMEELLSGYGRVRERPLSAVLDLYTAAALAFLLPESFRLFHPDAFDLTERLLDRALLLLARTEKRTAVS